MARRHYFGNGREIRKRGLTVEIKPTGNIESDVRTLESAIRTLKRKLVQEGIIRDLRRKEYYESKGQIRRRMKLDAIRREKKRRSNIED